MAQVIPDRVTATIEGDFVVFLIGMRVNKWWKIHRWLPPAVAMLRMLGELRRRPVSETGCLATSISTPGLTVQYWRSFDHLEAFARNASGTHMPAWSRFNKAAKQARGDVGIWHETYLVKDGCHESLYSGMPAQGLGKAGALVPASGSKQQARTRLYEGDPS